MHFHIHNDYFDIINDNWVQGWKETNTKTKHPQCRHYPYMLKFAVMRSNEDYYTMRAAKRGEKQANNEDL